MVVSNSDFSSCYYSVNNNEEVTAYIKQQTSDFILNNLASIVQPCIIDIYQLLQLDFKSISNINDIANLLKSLSEPNAIHTYIAKEDACNIEYIFKLEAICNKLIVDYLKAEDMLLKISESINLAQSKIFTVLKEVMFDLISQVAKEKEDLLKLKLLKPQEGKSDSQVNFNFQAENVEKDNTFVFDYSNVIEKPECLCYEQEVAPSLVNLDINGWDKAKIAFPLIVGQGKIKYEEYKKYVVGGIVGNISTDIVRNLFQRLAIAVSYLMEISKPVLPAIL